MTTVSLEYPITVNGQEIDRLSLRRPRVGDQMAMRKHSKDEAAQEIFLFSALAEVSPADIEKLDMKDYQKLQEVYRGFLS